MAKRLTLLSIATLALLLIWNCGKKQAVLAKIGTEMTISMQEFEEANARFRKGESREDDYKALKTKLDEMIETKLILMGAYEAGYDQDSTVMLTKQNTKIQHAMQKLYQRDVVNKYVRESDIRDYYVKTGREVVLRNIFLPIPQNSDSIEVVLIRQDAESILKKLDAGEDFEFLASRYSKDRQTAINGGLVGTLKYSTIGDPIQEAAFSMKAGEVSGIIENQQGFNIIKVEEVHEIEQKPYQEVRESIQQKVFRSKRDQIRQFADQYWDKLKIKAGVQLQSENIDSLVHIMSPWNTYLKDSVLAGLSELPDSILNMDLVLYNNSRVTVSEFKNWFQRVVGPEIRGRITSAKTLENMLDNLLMGELLYDVAKKKRLHRLPEVVSATRKAAERKMIQLFIDQVIWGDIDLTDEELMEYYQKHLDDKYTPPKKYKLQEIVVETEELANQVTAWAKAGQNFTTLVMNHSIKPGKDTNQGVENNVTRRRKPKQFACADSMSVGDISDPIKLSEKRYSIIKVLDVDRSKPKSFDEVKVRVRVHKSNEIKKERKAKWLEDKKRSVNIVIDEKRLESFLESIYADAS